MNLLACLIKPLGQLWAEIHIRPYLLDFWPEEFMKLKKQRGHSSGWHNPGILLWDRQDCHKQRVFYNFFSQPQKNGKCNLAQSRANAGKNKAFPDHCAIATVNLINRVEPEPRLFSNQTHAQQFKGPIWNAKFPFWDIFCCNSLCLLDLKEVRNNLSLFYRLKALTPHRFVSQACATTTCGHCNSISYSMELRLSVLAVVYKQRAKYGVNLPICCMS